MRPHERERWFDELLQHQFGCHAHPERVEEELADDPELRALAEEVRAFAATLEHAAVADAPELKLAPAPPRRKFPWRAVAALLVCAAALAPALRAAYLRVAAYRAEKSAVHLVVSGARTAPAGAARRFSVETTDLAGEPRLANVSWRLLGAGGELLASGAEGGRAELAIDVPPSLEAPARLEVRADAPGATAETALELATGGASPLAHLTVDKPLYRPGETVYLRAVLLDRATLSERPGSYRVRVTDPKGAVLWASIARPERGVFGRPWPLPEAAVGGNYAFELRDDRDQVTIERVPFTVLRFQATKLMKTIALDRASYEPGATGTADVTVLRQGSGAAAGARARGALVVDGAETWSAEAELDSEGRARFQFAVPADVERGEARFVARVEDRGIVETELKPFTIPTGVLAVAFYPESGRLLAGADNVVYAEVTDSLGRPADATGRILDATGSTVARFETLHQGRARFRLVPELGAEYRLEFDRPGVPGFALPAAERDVALLHVGAGGADPGAPLRAAVSVPGEGPWIAAAFCRGQLLASRTLRGAGEHALELDLPESAAGVLRVTLFDAELHPVAERLVHRASARDLRVEILPQSPRLLPGQQQRVAVRTLDAAGAPVAAVVGLTVSDRSVADLAAEPRVQLADHAHFFADVEALEDLGSFFLGSEHAERNVDLVLGTRGWRRYAWMQPEELAAAASDDRRRLVVLDGAAAAPLVREHASASAGEVARQRREAAKYQDVAVAAFFGLLALLFLLRVAGAAGRAIARRQPGSRFAPVFAQASVLLVPLAVVLALLATRQGRIGYLGPSDTVAAAPVRLFAAAQAEPGAKFAEIGAAGDAEAQQRRLQQLGYLGGAPAAAMFAPEQEQLNFGVEVAFEDELEEAKENPAALGRLAGRPAKDRQRIDPLPVLEFAYKNPNNPDRSDFRETIYWNAALATDADGRAEVEFDVSDAATTWSVYADAHGAGRVGQGAAEFAATLPFHLEATLPIEATAGDRLEIPVALVCEEPGLDSVRVSAQVDGPIALAEAIDGDYPVANGGGRMLVPLVVADGAGSATLRIAGGAKRVADRVERSIRVVPRGFPQQISKGGRVQDRAELAFDLPEHWTPGSLTATLKLYPSPLASMLDGLDGLLAEPGGCFEQASSRNYPNLMALSFLDASGTGDDPALRQRARGLLERGYALVTGYECTEQGFEWFGADPGHEALSAYGLLEFQDMGRVFPVDPALVERTRAWLLSRRDGSGGYRRNARALDSFGAAPASVTDAYVTYALALTARDPAELRAELDRLEATAATGSDPYELALAARALARAGRGAAAETARERLKEAQADDGAVRGAASSITSSRGVDLAVETTGFAVLAWLEDADDRSAAARGVDFLLAQRGAGGTFGATQATIVALQALTAWADANRAIARAGAVELTVNDSALERRDFAAGERGALVFSIPAAALQPGANAVALALAGGNDFPFAFDVAFHTDQPADDPDGAIGIETSLERETAMEGEVVGLTARVTNRTGEGVPMTLAVVGLPAGLEAQPAVLDALKKAGTVDLWEQNGRELVFYWRGLAPSETRELRLDLVAKIPGTSAGPASRAYLYYTPRAKRYAAPLAILIGAR